jgi:DUF4097 and DUF4098 domain-containing protein YvlB
MRVFGLLATLLFLCTACNKSGSEDGLSRVNGSVHITAAQPNGNAATVNGAISIDDKAVFGTADTVNGDVWVGAGASGSTAKTVNGNITLDTGAHLTGELSSVNGSLTMNKDADAAGRMSNVNGTITLNDAHVAGGIATVNGDINVNGASRVEGGIHVHKLSMGILQGEHQPPRIIIGPGASVTGEMKFERTVKLYVSDKATIGAVSGAEPIRFSGDKPTL